MTNMKLMVVDDSRVMRGKIQRAVEQVGILNVMCAGNGKEAVDMFQQERPKIVTMDITMPEMDGIECIKHLVQFDPSVLILVISALSDKTTTMEALLSGAKGFLKKPFDDADLNEKIREMLAMELVES